MIIGCEKQFNLWEIVRDMKSFTSTQLKKAIINNPAESRKDWILEIMTNTGQLNSNNRSFQFWQQHNHPIELINYKITRQKLDYLHNNPVEEGFVVEAEDFLYSSARDYAGKKGLIDIKFL